VQAIVYSPNAQPGSGCEGIPQCHGFNQRLSGLCRTTRSTTGRPPTPHHHDAEVPPYSMRLSPRTTSPTIPLYPLEPLLPRFHFPSPHAWTPAYTLTCSLQHIGMPLVTAADLPSVSGGPPALFHALLPLHLQNVTFREVLVDGWPHIFVVAQRVRDPYCLK